MEWAALAIPMIAGLVLHYKFRKKILWWEVVIPMLPVLVIVPLVKLAAETSITRDYERHGGWCVKAVYLEDWDEWVSKTCTRKVGKTTQSYDCSYRRYHPPVWYLIDSNGYQVTITKSQFEWLSQKFGSRQFIDLHRYYYRDDGDEYDAIWPGTDITFQPVTTEHTYENRVQATHGVIDFPEITPKEAKEKGLYEFPTLENPLCDWPILGTTTGVEQADKIIQTYNAKMGKLKEIRIWIILFHEKPLQTAFDQESYWKGGNDNELVVCIGLFENQPAWCHPFCWSPDGNTSNDQLKIEIRDRVQSYGPNLNLAPIAEFITSRATELYQRKDFKEFSYLTVDTPWWATLIVYVLVILSTGGLSWWIMENEASEFDPTPWKRYL